MFKNRKTKWLGLFSSLVLTGLVFTACGAKNPDGNVPTESAPAKPSPTDETGEEIEVISDISDIFGETETNTSTSGSSDALPAGSEIDANGIPVGFTENGNPYRGNPNAPVVIEEFSDFQ